MNRTDSGCGVLTLLLLEHLAVGARRQLGGGRPGTRAPARRPLWWLGPAIAAFVVMVLVASFGLVGLLLVGPRALRHLF
jgi:hypothetical protein